MPHFFQLRIPLLIGGATTSKQHTAVKIAPKYSAPVVHVLDASKSVVVCSSLLDEANKDDFFEELREEYEDIRQDHYENVAEKVYLPLKSARENGLRLDWATFAPTRPTFVGEKVFRNFPLTDLLPFIDWKCFFDVWELSGRYPNGRYPKIFNDENVGAEAKKIFDEAQTMLKDIIANGSLEARGVVGFYPANSSGDDILIVDPDSGDHAATLFGLRQQTEPHENSRRCLCLSDFVAPKESGKQDFVGMFAVSVGFGCEELRAKFVEANDDYNSIMVSALADRLSEAFAELLHLKVRTELWGYASGETLSSNELFRSSFAGIRPAPGYPTQPDHTEKLTMWKLMNVEETTGIGLTESLAMTPAASVSGLYFAHPEATYFSLGKIQKDQVGTSLLLKLFSVHLTSSPRWTTGHIISYNFND